MLYMVSAMKLSFVVNGIADGVKPTMSKGLVGFHVIAFSPFVPRLQEQYLVLWSFILYMVHGIKYGFLEPLWCGLN